MLPALNEISTCQSSPTQDIMDKYNQVLDYASTNPNATIHYHAKNMILMIDIDATYLVLPEACSRFSVYDYFTNRMHDYPKGTPTQNVPIVEKFNTLKTVLSSSAEAEICGTFENAQNAIPLRQSHISRHPHLFYKTSQIENLGYEIPLARRPYFSKTHTTTMETRNTQLG